MYIDSWNFPGRICQTESLCRGVSLGDQPSCTVPCPGSSASTPGNQSETSIRGRVSQCRTPPLYRTPQYDDADRSLCDQSSVTFPQPRLGLQPPHHKRSAFRKLTSMWERTGTQCAVSPQRCVPPQPHLASILYKIFSSSCNMFFKKILTQNNAA